MAELIHISDLHFDRVVEGTVDALVEAIGRMAPDVVVISGDFTLRGTHEEFRSARSFLERIRHPIVGVPGNHDVPAYAPIERAARPFGRFRRHLGDVLASSYESDDLLILGLNTARAWSLHWNWADGRLSRDQVRRADAAFGRARPGQHTCLVVHHPFAVPMGLRGFRAVGRGREMIDVLRRHDVELVLTGHLHRGAWSAGGQPLFIQGPTATSDRLRDGPNGFYQIRLQEERTEIQAWIWDANAFVPGEAHRIDRSIAGGR